MPRTLDPERLRNAKTLLDEGKSIPEVHRETGIALPTLYKYFRKDPTPGGNGRKRATQKKQKSATDEQLTGLFAKVATAPAIPMGLWVHCDFCANHFVQNGPDAASKLVEMSHEHPALRSVMEGLWRYADEIAWAGILASWAGIPVAHHLAPDFVYKWIQMPLGLPSRNGHEHADTNGNGVSTSPQVPTPFAGMDMDAILAMAKNMGIDIDISGMMEQDAPGTAPADTEPETAPPAEPPAASEATPAASDTDTEQRPA